VFKSGLTDYKLFVFGGRAEFIQVDTDRATDHKRVFYNRDWIRQAFTISFRHKDGSLWYPLETREIERPRHLAEMMDAAEKLGSGFNFVRVDLYDLDSGPKFGEMTFAPGAGCESFHPVAYDRIFGELWI
jgi:hypothetical protein